MSACLNWYIDKFPALLTETYLDLSNINNIIPAIVFIGLDFKTLVNIDETHEALVYRESKPNHALWDLVEKTVRQKIPNFQMQLVAYLKWAFGEKEEKQWDIGSRPPVGRYAPSLRRQSRSSGGNFRDKGDRPQRRGGNHRNGNDRGHQSDKRNDRRSSINKEKHALIDVNNAVKKLAKDASLEEVVLAPTNSFFRRLQHKHAISQGFDSISRGEGHDRSVVVKRSKD